MLIIVRCIPKYLTGFNHSTYYVFSLVVISIVKQKCFVTQIYVKQITVDPLF